MLTITFPFHGAVLNHRHGRQTDHGLFIEVKGTAPLNMEVQVNGIPAERRGGEFRATLCLNAYRNEIHAIGIGTEGSARHDIQVIWDKHSCKRYRVSIDDNSFFLRDLYKNNPDNILDNYYLRILKKIHDAYGTKYTLNLFYETPEKDFNLSMLPDKWKQQFQDNADWMRLTWHAYAEFPDRPYQYATVEKVLADFDLIHEEIQRFAGEGAWAPPTICHWGELPLQALKPLYERGVRVLSGYFIKDESQHYLVSYGLDETRCAYIAAHNALLHVPSGVIFSHIAAVINLTPVEKIIPTLSKWIANPDTAEIVDLLTHEQYFWPFYFNYQPDQPTRLETAARFLAENDYKPVFYHEGIMGVQRA